jgi:hypothetical protein
LSGVPAGQAFSDKADDIGGDWNRLSPFILSQPPIVFGEDAEHHTRDGVCSPCHASTLLFFDPNRPSK